MAAYVIVDIQISDSVTYEEYKQQAAGTVEAFGGRYIARGGTVETLEGDWVPGRTVLLEFPTLQRAKEWWGSDLYAPIRALRHRSARSRMIVVQGV
jgi:uncharacterized protein (DUF1330 family)